MSHAPVTPNSRSTEAILTAVAAIVHVGRWLNHWIHLPCGYVSKTAGWTAVGVLLILSPGGLRNTLGQTTAASPAEAHPGDTTSEAERLYTAELERRKKLYGEFTPEVAEAVSNFAVLKRKQGKAVEAERLFRQALAIQRKLHGPEHFEVADSLKRRRHHAGGARQARGRRSSTARSRANDEATPGSRSPRADL